MTTVQWKDQTTWLADHLNQSCRSILFWSLAVFSLSLAWFVISWNQPCSLRTPYGNPPIYNDGKLRWVILCTVTRNHGEHCWHLNSKTINTETKSYLTVLYTPLMVYTSCLLLPGVYIVIRNILTGANIMKYIPSLVFDNSEVWGHKGRRQNPWLLAAAKILQHSTAMYSFSYTCWLQLAAE